MPKHGNDNLDDFFRKVSDLPDIPFNEEDWKKLEARLEAKETRLQSIRRKRNRMTGAVVLAVLLMSSYYWIGEHTSEKPDKEKVSEVREAPDAGQLTSDGNTINLPAVLPEGLRSRKELSSKAASNGAVSNVNRQDNSIRLSSGIDEKLTTHRLDNNSFRDNDRVLVDDLKGQEPAVDGKNDNLTNPSVNIDKDIPEEPQISPAIAEENKQRANIQLPEAEEDEAAVSAVLGIDKANRSASPRLSLLLSLAPDFSSTSFGEYSDPGESFGVLIHYHVKNAWSFSTGIVKSNKKYTGEGEDYHPPKSYWKNFTNGIIPASVDGSCSVLEIPVMIQFTIASPGRSKFTVGAGASSYIMLDEAYSYKFEEPNPGAKEGWSSGKNSGFLFNMINFTIGYEYQILPRFMLGVEPYVKIPIEDIGWSNLKLFSTGVSMTLRYNVLNKKHPALSTRSRGPD